MERSSEKIIKKFTNKMQARLLLVFCILTVLLTCLIGRLIYIMQTDGERYAKHVLSRQSYKSKVLPYKRGDIVDRNGTALAKSDLRYKLILDPENLLLHSDCIPATLKALKDNFGVKEDDVNKILEDKADSQYVILQKDLLYDPVNKFKTLMNDNKSIAGVWFEEEYVRTYPNDTLACDVIGFSSADNKGFYGIEEYYNDELNGTNGREYGYYDSSLNIERIVKNPVNGNTIVSTIDANVQRIIQKYINEFNEEYGSKNLGMLVMNPNTGEILAMASNKEYNLNSPQDLEGLYTKQEISAMTQEKKTEVLNSLWKNDVISSGYEPGSTYKPFTVSAGLEENLVSEKSTFICDGGQKVGGWDIGCTHIHGKLTLGGALVKSCNDALMQIGAIEGKSIFSRYQKNFGFGSKTGIDLPGEASGIIKDAKDMNVTDLATESFGQNINVTMIQMASAFCSLVNGGSYYQPHIVKQIVNDEGATVKQFDPVLVKKTVSEQTSKFIQKYMYQTVEKGTATGAKVEGYAVGGKTGTAEKYPREAKNYLVSFLGEVPAVNPEVVIYITIDQPEKVTRQDDSSLATKLAGKVLKEILPALGIYPKGKIDYFPDDTKNEEDSTNKDSQTVNKEDNNQDNQTANKEENSNQDNQTADKEDNSQNNQTGNTENNNAVNEQDTTNTDTGQSTKTAGEQKTE